MKNKGGTCVKRNKRFLLENLEFGWKFVGKGGGKWGKNEKK